MFVYYSGLLTMKVAVIGGGPSGLVTLKYLLRAHLSLDCEPIEARLFELGDSVGANPLKQNIRDDRSG